MFIDAGLQGDVFKNERYVGTPGKVSVRFIGRWFVFIACWPVSLWKKLCPLRNSVLWRRIKGEARCPWALVLSAGTLVVPWSWPGQPTWGIAHLKCFIFKLLLVILNRGGRAAAAAQDSSSARLPCNISLFLSHRLKTKSPKTKKRNRRE